MSLNNTLQIDFHCEDDTCISLFSYESALAFMKESYYMIRSIWSNSSNVEEKLFEAYFQIQDNYLTEEELYNE